MVLVSKETKLVLVGYEARKKDTDGIYKLVWPVSRFKTVEACLEAGGKKVKPIYVKRRR